MKYVTFKNLEGKTSVVYITRNRDGLYWKFLNQWNSAAIMQYRRKTHREWKEISQAPGEKTKEKYGKDGREGKWRIKSSVAWTDLKDSQGLRCIENVIFDIIF